MTHYKFSGHYSTLICCDKHSMNAILILTFRRDISGFMHEKCWSSVKPVMQINTIVTNTLTINRRPLWMVRQMLGVLDVARLRKHESASRQNRDVSQRACRQEFACERCDVNVARASMREQAGASFVRCTGSSIRTDIITLCTLARARCCCISS